MADLKITQLNEVTAPITSDILPIVNSSETKKVSIANLSNSLPLNSFVASNSANWGGVFSYGLATYQGAYTGGPLYTGDNLINNTDNYLPWDVFNTNNSGMFELINPDTANARLAIKQTGTYFILARVCYFDCYNNTMSVFFDRNTSSTGGVWLRTKTLYQQWFPVWGVGSPPAVVMNGSHIESVASAPIYFSLAVRPTANVPFPAVVDGNTFTQMLVYRLGGI